MASTTNKNQGGSRPSPTNRPSTSSLSIFFIMVLVVAGAFIASGSLVPVDPNGPGGPPVLEPYYNPADYPNQQIITPTGSLGTQQNLQLKTFQVNNCGKNSVIFFVIDTSGSMKFANKINNIKKALTYFTNNMGGKSVIGMDTFGVDVKERIPLSYYSDVKPQVKTVINGLSPEGGTPTRDVMQLAYNQLSKSINEEDYPGYQYNLVLMTDGVPEIMPPRTCEATAPDPNTAPLERCFAQQQDPTVPNDISTEIRSLGVDIYTINVYSPSYPSDKILFPYLDKLLKKISSTPLSSHYFVSINGGTLNNILQNIENNICYNNFNGTAIQ